VFLDNPPSHMSWLCPGFKKFLSYAMPRFLEIKEDIIRRRAASGARMRQAGPANMPVAAPGRNDPCPCGSGKKYKKCCGVNEGRVSGGEGRGK
jgi:hypothetical protein